MTATTWALRWQPEPQAAQTYALALDTYLKGQQEEARRAARETGRDLRREGQAPLLLVAIHHQALADALTTGRRGYEREVLTAASELLNEALVAFQVGNDDTESAFLSSEALTKLVGAFAHDIRGPLTSIMASAGMLQEVLDSHLDGQQQKLLANIIEGGTKIRDWTDELTDLAGFLSGQLALDVQRVGLRDILHPLVDDLRSIVQNAGLQFFVTIDDKVPEEMSLDAKRLEQAITQLVHNAVRFGADGGEVRVSIDYPQALRVQVMDRGKGIPADRQEGLFQPFHRVLKAGPRVPGMGLGLPLCAQIARLHGGWVRLESGEGQGTVVWLVIPDQATRTDTGREEGE